MQRGKSSTRIYQFNEVMSSLCAAADKLESNGCRLYSPEEHVKSVDGIDLAFAVNFVGPVLFMQMLAPLLRDNAPSTGTLAFTTHAF